MKNNFLALCISTFGLVSAGAQNLQSPVKNKSAEQQEIKADQHLKKQLQQKQLNNPPQLLKDTSVRRGAVTTKTKIAGKKTTTKKVSTTKHR